MTSDHARYCCSIMVPSCYHNPYPFLEGPVHGIFHHYHCLLRDSLHIAEEYLLSSRRVRMLILADSPFIFLSKYSHRPSIPSLGTYYIRRRYHPLIWSLISPSAADISRCQFGAVRTTMDNLAHKLMGLYYMHILDLLDYEIELVTPSSDNLLFAIATSFVRCTRWTLLFSILL